MAGVICVATGVIAPDYVCVAAIWTSGAGGLLYGAVALGIAAKEGAGCVYAGDWDNCVRRVDEEDFASLNALRCLQLAALVGVHALC